MNSLETAVAVISKWPASKAKEQAAARAALAGLIADCEAAVKVWEGYLAAPTTSADRWSIVSWIGAERAKLLHELNLSAKARLALICRSAGGMAARTVDLEDELIEMAYRMLRPGEAGPDAARSAVQALQGRIEYLRGLSAQLAARPPDAKPKSGAGRPKPAARKSAPSKKAAKKGTVSKGKKKAAKRKK